MRSRTNTRLVLSLLVVAVATVAGGLIGDKVLATSDNIDTRQLQTFAEIVDLLQQSYVDEVETDKVVYASIQGMLRTLDPHSNFLDPKVYAHMKEEQKGSFYGLGIVVSMRGDKLTVISPIDGTPAQRAGIRAGDIISQIEGDDTAGMHIDVAVQKLRGPKGTKVHILVMRPGRMDPLAFEIERDEIETKSISYAFMVRQGVGYVRIKNFTNTTSAELDQALGELSGQGMEKLLLDLRGNPGGLLDQAVKVAGKFITRGKMIVYTRGRAFGSAQQYYATGDEMPVTIPVVVLVNQASASASEIVSGAIQDHDRGLIVGETTWGKGLVQSVYQLPEGTGLALTTAKYYTPSGRLIQRDYSTSFDDYLFPNRKSRTILPDDQREQKYTDTGRKVLGGGGISPDVVVKPAEVEPGSFIDRIGADAFYNGDVFFTYATGRFAPWAQKEGLEVTEDMPISDDMLRDFSDYLTDQKIEHTWDEVAQNRDYLQLALRKEILAAKYGPLAGYKVAIEGDQQVQKALTLFSEARQLAMLAVQQAASKGTVNLSDLEGRESSSKSVEGGEPLRP